MQTFFGEPVEPCDDCWDGLCTMNCSRPVKSLALSADDWRHSDSAPKDGTHILVCTGPYDENWGFNQSPPVVVHYWGNPGEEGFYPSSGIVEGSYNDEPVKFTRWRSLGSTPR